jgi:hypothetical protein
MAESTKNGDSPRNYVVYQTGASLSGATYSGITLTGGSYGTAGTAYTAGTPDWNKLRLDPSRFTAQSNLPIWSPVQTAEAGSATPYAGAADVTDGSNGATGKARYRYYSQAALQDSAGAWHVAGNWPGSSVPGTSSGLIADPTDATRSLAVTDSAPGTLTGSSSQGGQSQPQWQPTYFLSGSVRLRSSAPGYLSKTLGTPTSQNSYTFSTWIKRSELGRNQTIFEAYSNGSSGVYYGDIFMFNSSDQLFVENGNGAGYSVLLTSTAAFRDTSAWYHVVYVRNGNAVTVYVNGNQVLSGNSSGNSSYMNTAVPTTIGGLYASRYGGASGYYTQGYLSDVYFVDGQALAPSAFAQNDPNGVWAPKAFTGTYGANGFRLDFSSGAALGNDVAPNGGGHAAANNWAVSGINATDQMVDSPTNNFSVFDRANTSVAATYMNPTLDNALLSVATPDAYQRYGYGSISVTSGKFYIENVVTGVGSGGAYYLGFGAYYAHNGTIAGCSPTTAGAVYTTGDVIGVAVDATNGTVEFFKNGVSQGGQRTFGTGGVLTPVVSVGGQASSGYVNFGQGGQDFTTGNKGAAAPYSDSGGIGKFRYQPPAGFKALSTANLPALTVANPKQYFEVLTYAGNGTTQDIAGLQFQPDFSWVKERTNG